MSELVEQLSKAAKEIDDCVKVLKEDSKQAVDGCLKHLLFKHAESVMHQEKEFETAIYGALMRAVSRSSPERQKYSEELRADIRKAISELEGNQS